MAVERGRHLHFRTAAGKVNCPSTYPFAHSNAEPTKDAVVVLELESRSLNTVLLSEFQPQHRIALRVS
jgi:hypothetical protein